MKQKKIPMRTCVVTKEKIPKKELIRIVRTTNGEILVDKTGKINGHGAYIKRDIEVLNIARKTKILDRYLEVEIGDDIYEYLINIIND